MASSTTIKLSNRSSKQPIKKLPATLDVPANSTVEDVKILIARAAGIRDFNRLGIYDPTTKKTVKDRRAKVLDVAGIASSGELLVKDMGPQLAWRTVYAIEYLGPILFHLSIFTLRPYIYSNAPSTVSRAQWISFAMIIAHFLKREYETYFVHKFSANTMPVFNVFKNSAYYWLMSGLVTAYFIYSPTSIAATTDQPAVDAVALALYLFGEVGTALVHYYLSSLRSTGGTERKIPVGYGFSLVTCPNYMYEVIAWVGIIIATRNWSVIVFISVGTAQMYFWAVGKEKAYRKEFGDKYKKKRYVMLPGLL